MSSGHVDRFSVGLDDLTRKEQRSLVCVARVLASAGRFSAFEASENDDIANTMTVLMAIGWFTNKGGGYPWTYVEITPCGTAALKADPVRVALLRRAYLTARRRDESASEAWGKRSDKEHSVRNERRMRGLPVIAAPIGKFQISASMRDAHTELQRAITALRDVGGAA